MPRLRTNELRSLNNGFRWLTEVSLLLTNIISLLTNVFCLLTNVHLVLTNRFVWNVLRVLSTVSSVLRQQHKIVCSLEVAPDS